MSADILVSCILPCRGRVALTAQAVACYLAQTWALKELIIVDDSEAPAFPTPPTIEGVFYWAETGRKAIGAKRNLAVSRAHGQILCHWDSDDYSAPGRIEDQVARLLESGMDVTGYHSMIFLDEASKRAWRYHGRPGIALGSSLCYRKAFWQRHPFPPEQNLGEDGTFCRAAGSRLISADARDLMFARQHSDNTSPRTLADRRIWEPLAWPVEDGKGTMEVCNA